MAHKVEDPPTTQETWVRSLSWDDPLEKGMSTHCILSGESHGQGSLAGYSPWGCKELDTTEVTWYTYPKILKWEY